MVEIKKCFLTKNDCYKAGKTMTPKQIVVHSTGANNKYIKRYVQPDDGILGKNPNGNDWNRPKVSKCVNAFVGLDNAGKIRIYQTLPWNMKSWGCGVGNKGSYNNSAIQFEICEDALTDKNYFNTAFDIAIELCTYLCKTYKIKPENIVSHHEAHVLGYASDHGDCDHWLKKFGKDMDWFRAEVNKRLNPVTTTTSKYTKTDFIKDLQKAVGVKVDGVVGSKTLAALPVLSKTRNSTHACVKYLQMYLNTLGYKCTTDGKYATAYSAVVSYQKVNKLSADGVVGNNTWSKLLK